jgi:hypothetical protein
MVEPMPAERIAELRALADAATKGPWVWSDGILQQALVMHDIIIWPTSAINGGHDGDEPTPGEQLGAVGDHAEEHAADNMAFIAAARTALPELLAEFERLQRELDGARAYRQRVFDRIQTWSDDPQTRLEAFAITWERADELKRERDEARAELGDLHEANDKLGRALVDARAELAKAREAIAEEVTQVIQAQYDALPSDDHWEAAAGVLHAVATAVREALSAAPSAVETPTPDQTDWPTFARQLLAQEAASSVALDGDTFTIDQPAAPVAAPDGGE